MHKKYNHMIPYYSSLPNMSQVELLKDCTIETKRNPSSRAFYSFARKEGSVLQSLFIQTESCTADNKNLSV